MNIQCFMVEQTGNIKREHIDCGVKDCTCGGYDKETPEWKRLDTGELFFAPVYNLPEGAMYWQECWDVHNDENGKEIARYKGTGQWDNDDGMHLMVTLPGCPEAEPAYYMTHTWDIDSRCSNCGSPNDRLHRCWVRTGTPPFITVHKNGNTCVAGAGSVLVSWGKEGSYHAMLENGILRQV